MVPNLKYADLRRILAGDLMNIGAVLTRESDHRLVVEREGPNGPERGFLLKLHQDTPTAPLSPFFLNLRTPDNPKPGPLTREIVEMAAACMSRLAMMESFDYDAVAGVPRAGDPFAKAFANMRGANARLIKMGKEEKGDTRHVATIVGEIPGEGSRVLVLDDLVTQAGSKLEAIDVLKQARVSIAGVVVLVDREQGGRQELARRGYELRSVFTISELLDVYVAGGTMKPEFAAEIKAYLAAN